MTCDPPSEVGTYTGYSSIAMALALPPDGKLVACDVSEPSFEVARRYWAEAGVEQKIEERLGDAKATLDDIIAAGGAGSFDIAFVDADKRGYWEYYEKLLTLVRPGGLIAIDNVLWYGRVADPEQLDKQTVAIRVGVSLNPLGKRTGSELFSSRERRFYRNCLHSRPRWRL